MGEVIDHMGSYFAAAHHEVTAPDFAAGVLDRQRRIVEEAFEAGAILPAKLVDAVRTMVIGDPLAPVGAPLPAYVNAGRWLVHCPDCAGCEFADFSIAVFLCCSCWNASVGGAWRSVALPTPVLRGAAERLLLRRRDELNRNFRPDRGETLLHLARENRVNGLDRSVT